jgi:hypothetical protein
MLLLILVILLVLAIAGSGPWYPYSSSWGYYPSGLLTVLLVIVLIFVLMGRR